MMKDKLKSVFIDTNILVRFFIPTAPQHQEIRQVVNQFWQGNTQLWISRQIIREFGAVITRPQNYSNPFTSADAAKQMKLLPQSFFIADENKDVGDKLLDLMTKHPMGGKQVHDTNIVATMQVYAINHLVTLNIADFLRFGNTITLLKLDDLIKP